MSVASIFRVYTVQNLPTGIRKFIKQKSRKEMLLTVAQHRMGQYCKDKNEWLGLVCCKMWYSTVLCTVQNCNLQKYNTKNIRQTLLYCHTPALFWNCFRGKDASHCGIHELCNTFDRRVETGSGILATNTWICIIAQYSTVVQSLYYELVGHTQEVPTSHQLPPWRGQVKALDSRGHSRYSLCCLDFNNIQ